MESRHATLATHLDGVSPVLRPILTSLNGDNSWLISIPRPLDDRHSLGNAYFHIVSDAWLQGTGVPLLSKWLASLDLVARPAVADGDAVEAIVHEIEDAAAAAGFIPKLDGKNADSSKRSGVDAIFINIHLPDHLSKETLSTFSAAVPVFATPEAATIINSWKYFDRVNEINDLDPEDTDWRNLHPGAPLPEWLSVFRLVGHHQLNFATAIVFSSSDDHYEALLYSPHGILCDQASIQTFPGRATPPVSTLAMLHALKDSFAYGSRTTLGVSGGLALERFVKPKYWIKSHDAPIDYRGPVMWGVKEIDRSLDWGLEEEKKSYTAKGQTSDLWRPNLIEIGNGECFVLG
jgi:hypothetical protein